jgi:hypothetical protein
MCIAHFYKFCTCVWKNNSLQHPKIKTSVNTVNFKIKYPKNSQIFNKTSKTSKKHYRLKSIESQQKSTETEKS